MDEGKARMYAKYILDRLKVGHSEEDIISSFRNDKFSDEWIDYFFALAYEIEKQELPEVTSSAIDDSKRDDGIYQLEKYMTEARKITEEVPESEKNKIIAEEKKEQRFNKRDSWRLIVDSIRIYRQNWKVFFTIVLGVLLFNWAGEYFDSSLLPNWVTIVLIPVVLLFPSYVTLLYLYGSMSSNSGNDVISVFKRSGKRVISFWWMVVLGFLIPLGGSIPLIVPGVILSVLFSLSIFVFVYDNETGLRALLKSKEYLKGNVSDLFVKGFVLGAITIPVSIIISGLETQPQFIYEQLLVALGYLYFPIPISFFSLFFQDIKSQKGYIEIIVTRKQKYIYYALAVLGIIGFIALVLSRIAVSLLLPNI